MTKKPTKETKALTPAKKPAKTVRKTPAASAPVVKPAAAVPAAKPVASAPATKPAEPKKVVTTISASFDVGFGNGMYLRGEGPGLSWDKGLPLSNVKADKWSLALSGVTKPVVFKLLINDEVWSGGEDYVVAPGASTDLVPTFPGW